MANHNEPSGCPALSGDALASWNLACALEASVAVLSRLSGRSGSGDIGHAQVWASVMGCGSVHGGWNDSILLNFSNHKHPAKINSLFVTGSYWDLYPRNPVEAQTSLSSLKGSVLGVIKTWVLQLINRFK